MNNPIVKYSNADQSFDFVLNTDKICINISGGADGALLLYLVVDYCTKYIPNAEIFCVTFARSENSYYNLQASSRVIAQVINLTKTKMIRRHHTLISPERNYDRKWIVEVEKEIFEKHNAGIFISGSTTNNLTDNSLLESRPMQRDPGHKIQKNLVSNWGANRFNPIIDVDKKLIADVYKQLNLIDNLFDYTRSCELLEEKGEESNGHCGKCFSCRERKWAFGRL